jgi:hypothetical protein
MCFKCVFLTNKPEGTKLKKMPVTKKRLLQKNGKNAEKEKTSKMIIFTQIQCIKFCKKKFQIPNSRLLLHPIRLSIDHLAGRLHRVDDRELVAGPLGGEHSPVDSVEPVDRLRRVRARLVAGRLYQKFGRRRMDQAPSGKMENYF